MKLLDQGNPYEQPGRHRRIPFSDLLRYIRQRREEYAAALARMPGKASSAGIYGGRPEDCAAALKKARKRRAAQDGAGLSRYAVVLDACVLVPVALADTMLKSGRCRRPTWTAQTDRSMRLRVQHYTEHRDHPCIG